MTPLGEPGATRARLAEVFGFDPHGPIYVIDMGSWRHYVCCMCEIGAVVRRYRHEQARRFLHQHRVEWGELL